MKKVQVNYRAISAYTLANNGHTWQVHTYQMYGLLVGSIIDAGLISIYLKRKEF
jgi:hypothetical protein